MKIRNKFFALTLALAVFSDISSFASFSDEKNIIASRIVHTVSPGLNYISSVEVCDNIRQEVFTFEYFPNSQTAIETAYGKYIYGFNSVGSMISAYTGEGRVVGGINTDFFITSTGIPLSCLVVDNEIITSCDDRVALGFDSDGNAVIGKPSINAEIVSYDRQRTIPVAHINKTPATWGVYLLTDKFYNTTKSSVDTVEIVLEPLEVFDKLPEYSAQLPAFENWSSLGHINEADEDTVTDVQESNTPSNIEDSAINGEYTDTLFENDVGDFFLEVGKSIKVTVTEIRDGVQNGIIPNGCFVACIPKDNFSYLAEGINIGDEFYISTSINDDFADAVNIFGAGTIIVEDKKAVPQEKNNVFTYRQPRTAAGIREDGTVIFVCVDGRNPGTSNGFTITELSDYLISNGCIKAINFDGGGSTTFYSADLGEHSPSLKNTPSDGKERRVADGLIFVNKSTPMDDVAYASMYPSEFIVFNKGVEQKLDVELLYADSNFYPVDVDNNEYILSVDDEYGYISDGVFYSSGKIGIANVYVTNTKNGLFFDVGKIIITDSVDKVVFSADKYILTPFEDRVNFNISAYLNTIPVSITNSSADFLISIYEDSKDGESILVPVDSTYAYIDNDSFITVKKGEKYVITVSLGSVTESIEVLSKEYPFKDNEFHWSSEKVYDMYEKNIFKGEIDSNGSRLFFPERNMTRTEFCVALTRILGLEPFVDTQTSEESSDAGYIIPTDIPEWAVAEILPLLKYGYVDEFLTYDEFGDTIIDSNKLITRIDVIRVLGSILLKKQGITVADDESKYIFNDFATDREQDYEYLQTVVNYDIIRGYEDGSVRQNSNLTRAEAATILSRFFDAMN